MASVWVEIVREPRGLSEWPMIEGWLRKAHARASEPGEFVGEHDLLFVARRFAGAPPVARAIGAATVRLMTDGDAEVMLGGGHRDASVPVFDAACRWARDAGAKGIVAQGRKGWGRVLGFPVIGVRGGETCYRLEF